MITATITRRSDAARRVERIDAEATKDKTRIWQAATCNPCSSATGLGHFLSGTWLNAFARHHGWLGAAGATIGAAVEDVARATYSGHHPGLGGAIRLLK